MEWQKKYQVWLVDVVYHSSSGKKRGKCHSVGPEHTDNRSDDLFWTVRKRLHGEAWFSAPTNMADEKLDGPTIPPAIAVL